ncbi:MAG: hypothetical protein ACJ74Q_15540 [Pyrinomonadaceae bacterium]
MSLAYTDALHPRSQVGIEEEIASRIFGGRPAARLRLEAECFTWLACDLLSIVQLELAIDPGKVSECVDAIVRILLDRAKATLAGEDGWFGEEDSGTLSKEILLAVLALARPELVTESASTAKRP